MGKQHSYFLDHNDLFQNLGVRHLHYHVDNTGFMKSGQCLIHWRNNIISLQIYNDTNMSKTMKNEVNAQFDLIGCQYAFFTLFIWLQLLCTTRLNQVSISFVDFLLAPYNINRSNSKSLFILHDISFLHTLESCLPVQE